MTGITSGSLNAPQSVNRTNSISTARPRAQRPKEGAPGEHQGQDTRWGSNAATGAFVSTKGSARFYKTGSYFDDAPWRREPGGGPVLINMIHEIGNLRSLYGEIVSVQAAASSVTRHHAAAVTTA